MLRACGASILLALSLAQFLLFIQQPTYALDTQQQRACALTQSRQFCQRIASTAYEARSETARPNVVKRAAAAYLLANAEYCQVGVLRGEQWCRECLAGTRLSRWLLRAVNH